MFSMMTFFVHDFVLLLFHSLFRSTNLQQKNSNICLIPHAVKVRCLHTHTYTHTIIITTYCEQREEEAERAHQQHHHHRS